MGIPYVYRFMSGGRYFIYDVNANGVVEVDRTLFDLITHIEWQHSDNDTTASRLALREDAAPTPPLAPDILSAALDAIIDANRSYGLFSDHHPTALQPLFTRDQLSLLYPAILRHLILCVNEQCNLRCAYCPYSGTYTYHRPHRSRRMTLDVATRAVRFFIEHSAFIREATTEQLHLGFYGGEPLLSLDVIEACDGYLHDNYPNERERITLAATSNLTLADPDILHRLATMQVQLTVSLDGPPQLHDRYRRDAADHGSAERVFRNLHWLQDNEPDYYRAHVVFNSVVAPPFDMETVVTFFESDDLVRGHPVTLNFVSPFDTTFYDQFGPDQVATRSAQMQRLRTKFINNVCSGDLLAAAPLTSLFGRRLASVIYRSQEWLPDTLSPGSACLPSCQRTFVDTTGGLFVCEKVSEAHQHLKVGTIYTGFDLNRLCDLLSGFVDVCASDCLDCWACRFCTNCFVTVSRESHLDAARRRSNCEYIKQTATEALEDYALAMTTTGKDMKMLYPISLSTSATEIACEFLRTLETPGHPPPPVSGAQ